MAQLSPRSDALSASGNDSLMGHQSTLPKGFSPDLHSDAAPTKLLPCHLGCHQESKKGEDGLRAQRLSIGGERITALLVCDGHGGPAAAGLTINLLFGLFAEAAHGDASGPGLAAAASKSFRHLHERLNLASSGTTSGTSATLCLVNETRAEVTCCNVGDSFAILVEASDATEPAKSKRLPIVTELTHNFRLGDDGEEQARVRAAGAKLGRALNRDGLPMGPLRAWPGGVMCASSIGDSDCENYISPEVRSAAFMSAPMSLVPGLSVTASVAGP